MMADSADDRLKAARAGQWYAFQRLDELLSSGGPLPAAWLPAAEHLVQDVPGPDDSGLRECVTCGETIRRVSAEDGIDPEDLDYYAWVGADGGGPMCGVSPVHSPRSEPALPRRVPGATLPGWREPAGPGHPGGSKVP